MFPDQNVHYTNNFNIGYPGVNFVKATEYHGKFNYDRGKAIIALEGSSPRYKRRGFSMAVPDSYNLPSKKAETLPTHAESVPSVDNRPPAYYPESVPPLDEAPPSATLDRRVDQLVIEDQIRREEEAMRAQQMLQPPQSEIYPRESPMEVPQPETTQEYVPEEPKPDVRLAVPPPAKVEPLGAAGTKRPSAQAYKEELDKQIQMKQQMKRDAVDSAKAQERQMVKNWQQ